MCGNIRSRLLCFSLFVASAASASVVDFQWHLQRTLSGEGSSAVDCQRAIVDLLRESVRLPDGVTVTGLAPSVEQPDALPGDLRAHAGTVSMLKIHAAGPSPVIVHIPTSAHEGAVSFFRRVDEGLHVGLPQLSRRSGLVSYEAGYPGEYVVVRGDGPTPIWRRAHASEFFDVTPVSAAPEAKAAWRLYRVAPDRITGPVPLVLIHGLGGDRWDEFVHWAEHSDEAAPLRQQFQLWNFEHPINGVTAPIGFSRAYPSFAESIVAYLARFIEEAEQDGVEIDGERYHFPAGPYAFVTHSQGGLKARAFLVNYPEHAERVFAVVALSCPHTGSPWATPEWVRHTLSKVGLTNILISERIVQGAIAEIILNGFFNVNRQSDLDTGWANFDREGGFGIPIRTFQAWYWPRGLTDVTLSPRDANLTGAREISGIEDDTFEPPVLLETYCGGLDLITPTERGGMHLDKFFVYAAFLDTIDAFTRALTGDAMQEFGYWERWAMNGGLGTVQMLMGIVESDGAQYPLGTYRVGDGLVPLQSQLILDGREPTVLYKTQVIRGWEVPVYPASLCEDLIETHTLALPERLRVLRGWSHLDTVTGRYNQKTGHSELFQRMLDDLLSALPAST